MSSRRIVFATLGSLGDLHPYIAIGKVLLARGHRAVIATTDRYRTTIEVEGIEYAGMRPHETQSGSLESIAARVFHTLRGPEILVRELLMPHVRDQYADLARACAGADLLVTHPLAVSGPLVHAKQGLPWASSILSPASLLSAHDPALVASSLFGHALRGLGRGAQRLLLGLAAGVLRRWERPLAELRADLGLPPPAQPALLHGQFSARLNLALFAPLLVEPQPDWPVNTILTGFARFDGATPPHAAARLDAFLAAGPPPLVFGLGSSVVMVAGGFWQQAIDAATALGRRAILLTGTPLGLPLPPGMAAFDYLPYSSVFAHAAAVVHPGGIGSLAQALAAGRPQLIVPAAFDQPDNARRAAALGVARSVPIRRANSRRLAHGLSALLSDSRVAAAARHIADQLADERGAERAADELLRVAA